MEGKSIIPDLTISAIRAHGTEPLPAYEKCLRIACEISPPPFGMAWYGEKYRRVAVDPSWLARSLVSNAAKEGEGSRKLWELAGRTPDDDISQKIREHAIDESRHAKLYIKMLVTAFPNSIDSSARSELQSLSPGYTKKDRPQRLSGVSELNLFDQIIQMNIGEIRTRIHQLLLQPVILAHCQPPLRRRLSSILDSLLQDETKHISYTARLINQVMSYKGDATFSQIMQRRLDEFNIITLQEVGEMTFEGA